MQETNSFSPMPCGIEKFLCDKDSPYTQTVTKVLDSYGIESVIAVSALTRNSAGRISREVLDYVVDNLLKTIKENAPVDGVFLCQHGATQAPGVDDAVGYVLEKVREAAGEKAVIGTSFDFHANVTEKVVNNADVVCGFRTYPHIDILETSQRMAVLGAEKLLGKKTPFMRMIKLPMFHQAEACLTVEGPMKELMEKADPAKFDGVYDISVFQVQPWLNAPEAGAAVVVIADTQEHADAAADYLAHEYWAIRKSLKYDLYDLDKVIDMACEKPGRPVIVSDSADAPPAGSPGDSPAVLARLIERGLEEELVSFMTLNDPAAAEKAFEVGVGNTAEFTLGGAYDKERVKPITVKAYVKLIHDGTIEVRHDNYKAAVSRMGKAAVLVVGNAHIVVAPFQVNSVYDDTYKCFGLNPAKADLIVAKSAIGYRSYYKKYTDLMFTVDTPGSSSSNLLQFDFDKITRPCYPFDDIEEYKPISYKTGYTAK